MVYKKYIKRRGKLYGPYYYKNIRDKDGKVRNIFLGTKKPYKKPILSWISYSFFKRKDFMILIFIFIVLAGLSLHYNINQDIIKEKKEVTFLSLFDKIFKQKITIFRSPNEPPDFVQESLPNQSELCEDISYHWDVDATDPNNDTLRYSVDKTLFSIDSNTGVIDFTPNKDQVGNYLSEEDAVAIIVKDPYQAGDLFIYGFIITAVNDAPNLNSIGNITTTQLVPYYKEITASDEENDPLTYYDDTSLFDISTVNNKGIIQFTPSKSDAGSYLINITVCDSSSLIPTANCSFSTIKCDYELINFTILPNNAPNITRLPNLTAIEEIPYYDYMNASDLDGDSITFSANTTLFSIDPISGEINFTPTNDDTGIHLIEFRATDSNGAVTKNIVSFNVININDPPNITSYYPEDDNLFVYESQIIYFNFTGIDIDKDDVISNRWILDSVVNESNPYQNYTLIFGYSDSNRTFNKTHNLLLWVYDKELVNDTNLWNITVLNTNRAPELKQEIPNQTWGQGSLNTNIDLDNYFIDYDLDELFFTYNFTTNLSKINVSIESINHIISLMPDPSWFGSETIYFIVNDSFDSTESNLVELIVYETNQSQQIIVPTPSGGGGGGGGGGGSSDIKIASLSIIVSPIIAAESNTTLRVPITLKNTGEVSLNRINLSAFEDSNQLSLSFSQSFWNSLAEGKSVSSELTIKTSTLTEKSYEISINGNVNSPKLTESNVLYLTSIPTNLTKLEVEILFAIDLFEENTECLELKELVTQAQEKQKLGKDQEAINLIESAVQSCRSIIKESRTQIPKIPTKPGFEFYLPIILSVFGLMVVIILILYVLYKRVRRR